MGLCTKTRRHQPPGSIGWYNILVKKRSYTVIYEADPEGGFVASVPALPGCYSQGDSLDEAKKNIIEAIELYLETLQEDNEAPPVEHNILQGRVEVAV